jgi:hypothetical protein
LIDSESAASNERMNDTETDIFVSLNSIYAIDGLEEIIIRRRDR